MRNEQVLTESRIVVDESSFSFGTLDDLDVELALDSFNDALSSLLRSGVPVSKFSLLLEIECRESLPIFSFLYDHRTAVDIETLRRLSTLLERCVDWDEHTFDVDPACQIDGTPYESWSLAYAARIGKTRSVASLTVSHSPCPDVCSVSAGEETVEVFCLTKAEQIPHFWQYVIRRDLVPADEFFALAERAYLTLYLHPDLDFGRFRGSYADVYPWVVQVLSILDRHFAATFERHNGVRNLIQDEMSAHGVNVSPESPQTHKKAAAMSERLVTVESAAYMCEWHAKRLWNVDRMHFSIPGVLPDGKTIIGIFVDHLMI